MFIQNVSHQIRTPLNIIMGFSQVLKDSKSIIPDEEAKGISDMIKQNANKLYRMVIMLYDSSVRSLNKDFRLCEDDIVSCNEIARESIASIEEYFPDVPMNFKSEVADSLTLHTNRLYLKRILRELLFNACKYSDCKNIWLRVSENESLVRFTVEDTGPGIADEYASQLFDLFSKSSDLTEGLGIGLPLTRHHVRNLGGDIRLDTDYKDGCRFIIEFSKT
jgi:signal transduction histidine kinase